MKEIKANAVYSPAEIADLLSVSDRTVMDALRTNMLNGNKIGNKWRVTGQAVLNYCNRGGNEV